MFLCCTLSLARSLCLCLSLSCLCFLSSLQLHPRSLVFSSGVPPSTLFFKEYCRAVCFCILPWPDLLPCIAFNHCSGIGSLFNGDNIYPIMLNAS
ncbi:MAG: hypothetical protein J3R72DRAFT_461296, partial [Linnemannia gamsii]